MRILLSTKIKSSGKIASSSSKSTFLKTGGRQVNNLGSISPSYLRTAFTAVAPKSVRIQSSCQCLFTLLGSTGTKAARRASMKLTPGVQSYLEDPKTSACQPGYLKSEVSSK